MFCLVEFLYNWQTLIAGVLALVAAFLGARLLNKQIKLSELQEDNRRKKKAMAARAALPLTLCAIIDYAEESIEALRSLYKSKKDGLSDVFEEPLQVPKIPGHVIESLQILIEYADMEVSNVLAKLIKRLQIQNSRLHSAINGNHISTGNVEQYIIDTVIIYEVTSSLFDYARFESESVSRKIEWDDIIRKLNFLNFQASLYSSIHQKITKHKNKSDLIE